MLYTSHLSSKSGPTPQSKPIPGAGQVLNSAGGYTWKIDDWGRLHRFLILGNEGGTYYASERKLTRENASVIERLLKVDGQRLVDIVVTVSHEGHAPKNDPAILALAMAAKLGDRDTRAKALAALPKVCRIGTHLFQFAECLQALGGGWGRGTRAAVARWYNDKDPDDLAYQLLKYQQREGWSHRDLMRLAHPMPATNVHDELFKYVVKGEARFEQMPAMVEAVDEAKRADKVRLVELIREHNLPRECIPNQWLGDPEVWEALFEKMPMTALIRNLATMTRVGLLKTFGQETDRACEVITNAERLKKARVHPIQVLAALITYRSGHSARGESTWSPVAKIVDALDAAFYASFGNVEPSGAQTLLALDVSASMASGVIAGVPGLMPRVASAAMALITAATEKKYGFVAFTAGHNNPGRRPRGDEGMSILNITPRQRLDDVVRLISGIPFGGTDCSLPMLAAAQEGWMIDTFVIYTDNETWAGSVHPAKALQHYREKLGINAKCVVVGMTATGFSIADPNDAGMLDVVGFDTSTPQLISDFSKPVDKVKTE